MSDDKTKPAEERRIINVNEDHETRDWAKSLGVSDVELRKAVAAVGTSATAVREHLMRSTDVRLSESGAVLGRPDLEHGAYGMVKGKTGGEAPSPNPGCPHSHFPRSPASTGRPGPKKKARASLA